MSLNCEFVTAPDWNYNIEYSEDRMSGLPYQEDLFMPGFFEVDLSPNSSVIFCASTKKQNVEGRDLGTKVNWKITKQEKDFMTKSRN